MRVDPDPMNWWSGPGDTEKGLQPFEAEYLLRNLMDRHGLQDWRCEVVGGLLEDTENARHLGLCNITQKKIFLTKACIERSVAQVKDTILHEMAHALTRESNHTDVWAAAAWGLGVHATEIIRTIDDEDAHRYNENSPTLELQKGIAVVSEVLHPPRTRARLIDKMRPSAAGPA